MGALPFLQMADGWFSFADSGATMTTCLWSICVMPTPRACCGDSRTITGTRTRRCGPRMAKILFMLPATLPASWAFTAYGPRAARPAGGRNQRRLLYEFDNCTQRGQAGRQPVVPGLQHLADAAFGRQRLRGRRGQVPIFDTLRGFASVF